ncbi:MAG: hypothetical protein NEA02_16120 [Thermoanaerobaculia bacterium]|nr:hypothetical protein [Thermoanaerobaculia bacterium]
MRLRFPSSLFLLAPLAFASFGTAWLAAAAEPAEKSAAISGAFSVGGKPIKLASVAAFRDTGDARKHVVIVLSDKELPASTWKTGSDMSDWRREHPFQGLAFWINENNEDVRCEMYDGTAFPTYVSGVFDYKIARAPGAVSGSVKSNAGAGRLRTAVILDVTFKAPLK